jgi:hypothetical protein
MATINCAEQETGGQLLQGPILCIRSNKILNKIALLPRARFA